MLRMKLKSYSKTKQVGIELRNDDWLMCLIIKFVCDAAISIKIDILHICFCSFDLCCPILEKDNFVGSVCSVLSY